MSNIHGVGPGPMAAAISHTEAAAPSAAPSGVKINYGDPARAEGLNNMLTKIRQLTTKTQAFVLSRNTSLQ